MEAFQKSILGSVAHMYSVTVLSASVASVLYPLMFSLATVGCLLLLIWLCVRGINKTDQKKVASEGGAEQHSKPINYTLLLVAFLAVGLILRLIFAFIVKGYRPGVNEVVTLFTKLNSDGFGKNYYSQEGLNIFPLTYYVYSLMGLIYGLGLNANSVFTALLVKLPLIIADLITAYVLYRLARKYINSFVALVVAGFVCVFPVFVFASSVWGSTYSLLAMCVALTMYFMVNKNFIATIGCYSAAMLCHKSAIYIWPLIAVFVIYNFIKSIMALRAEKHSFTQMLKDTKTRQVFTVPICVAAFSVLSYLLSLPLMRDAYGAGFFTFIYKIYLQPLGSFENGFGHNSLGIFNVFMRNGAELNARFPVAVFVVLFAVIITGIVLLVYLSKKNRANLVYLAAYSFLTMATYFVGFDEFALLTALVVFLIAFLVVRDKRILAVMGVLSVAVIANASTVMSVAGHYSNAADSTLSAITQSATVLSGGYNAVSIVFSVLAVLAHLYATIVLLDISMSNKRKILTGSENATFGEAMKAFLNMKEN